MDSSVDKQELNANSNDAVMTAEKKSSGGAQSPPSRLEYRLGTLALQHNACNSSIETRVNP